MRTLLLAAALLSAPALADPAVQGPPAQDRPADDGYTVPYDRFTLRIKAGVTGVVVGMNLRF